MRALSEIIAEIVTARELLRSAKLSVALYSPSEAPQTLAQKTLARAQERCDSLEAELLDRLRRISAAD